MKCNVIQDLMVLYSDNCCCEESKAIVEEHISTCAECKKALEEMNSQPFTATTKDIQPPIKFKRINQWKASILQSILLFLSFALLTLGVALEASTPFGNSNGIWAISVIIPTTGFLLSLANWYFLRLYKSRKSFSNCSALVTLGLTLCGYIWAVFNYGTGVLNIFLAPHMTIIGIVLFISLCVLSKILSDIYARMLGKE